MLCARRVANGGREGKRETKGREIYRVEKGLGGRDESSARGANGSERIFLLLVRCCCLLHVHGRCRLRDLRCRLRVFGLHDRLERTLLQLAARLLE